MLFVMSSNHLFRAAGIVPLYWWAWFRDGEGKTAKRDILLFGMIASVFALLLSRSVSATLPFRPRPFLNADLHFKIPYGQSSQVLVGWSSFPSDHAAVYFTLAICLYFASRRLGVLAMCWALLVTCLPRVYLGLHYPSDILGGALLGLGVALLSKNGAVRIIATRRFMRCQESYPGLFYALLFVLSVQLDTAFESVLILKGYLTAIIHHAATLLH